jgi:transcription-repair coupling factor (superfamily II helicase)
MFFKREETLSEVAKRRLESLKEFADFGAGLKIAQRDLMIRGAGSILGEEQHGHMSQVGYDMYMNLLKESIALGDEGVSEEEASDCLVDLKISAFIPESYIKNVGTRLGVYKKMVVAKTEEELDELSRELEDIHGKIPHVVANLFELVRIKNVARKLDILEIREHGGALSLIFKEGPDEQILIRLKKLGTVQTGNGKQGQVKVVLKRGEKGLAGLGQVLIN